MRNYNGKEYKRIFTKAIALTEKDLTWIEKNKGKKSRAGFLQVIIKKYKNGQLLRKTK